MTQNELHCHSNIHELSWINDDVHIKGPGLTHLCYYGSASAQARSRSQCIPTVSASLHLQHAVYIFQANRSGPQRLSRVIIANNDRSTSIASVVGHEVHKISSMADLDISCILKNECSKYRECAVIHSLQRHHRKIIPPFGARTDLQPFCAKLFIRPREARK